MITLIAAIGKNNELGYQNKLLWSLPGDMKYFKENTTGKRVVMGRKTYESIGRPLPNRENIVITSHEIPEVKTVKSIDDILSLEGDTYIIGGASIYKEFIKYAGFLLLTEVDDSPTADAFFPEFDKSEYNKEIVGQNSDNGIEYTFVKYTKEVVQNGHK